MKQGSTRMEAVVEEEDEKKLLYLLIFGTLWQPPDHPAPVTALFSVLIFCLFVCPHKFRHLHLYLGLVYYSPTASCFHMEAPLNLNCEKESESLPRALLVSCSPIACKDVW